MCKKSTPSYTFVSYSSSQPYARLCLIKTGCTHRSLILDLVVYSFFTCTYTFKCLALSAMMTLGIWNPHDCHKEQSTPPLPTDLIKHNPSENVSYVWTLDLDVWTCPNAGNGEFGTGVSKYPFLLHESIVKVTRVQPLSNKWKSYIFAALASIAVWKRLKHVREPHCWTASHVPSFQSVGTFCHSIGFPL